MVPFALAKFFPKTRSISRTPSAVPGGEDRPAGLNSDGPPIWRGCRHAGPPRRAWPRTPHPARGPRRAQVHVAAGHLPALLRPAARPATRLQPLVGSGLLARRLLGRLLLRGRPPRLPGRPDQSLRVRTRTARQHQLAALEQHRGRTPRSPDTAGRRPPASAERTYGRSRRPTTRRAASRRSRPATARPEATSSSCFSSSAVNRTSVTFGKVLPQPRAQTSRPSGVTTNTRPSRSTQRRSTGVLSVFA